jgi:hypothetical protein
MIQPSDIKYKNYIKNKNVIIVGPATTLVGSGMGEFIDSHDIVIRTGGSFPVLKKYQLDYGKRCDSLYVNSLFAREVRIPINEYIDNGLSYLNMKEDRKNLYYRYKNLNLSIRVFKEEYLKTRKEVGTFPLLGNYIIYEMCCLFNPKSIYVTGMSLYSEEDINTHYLDDYLPKNSDPLKLNKTRVRSHNQSIQNKYLKRLISSESIKVDAHILKTLEL